MNMERLRESISRLLVKSGLESVFSMYPLRGGTNNKIFRIRVKNADYLLKVYFQHADDKRDRLKTEFSFSCFTWDNGLRCLPRPLGCDHVNHLGLYEFVEGRQMLSCEVREDMLQQALEFYIELNKHKSLNSAKSLPNASEACFSVASHLWCVEHRLQKLKDIENGSEIDHEARQFVQNEVTEVWHEVVDSVRNRACQFGIDLNTEIAQSDRCLSPSDFGFHNAIVASDGRLYFVDFEYAGWDDPAKMVCDFFCQVAIPVPMDYYDVFAGAVIRDLSDPEMQSQRIAFLLPVYRIKWCCIILNEFLPVDCQRRSFAGLGVNQKEQKFKQLDKARKVLQGLTEQKGWIYGTH